MPGPSSSAMNASANPKTVEEYIARAPEASRPHLEQIRSIVRTEAPGAVEKIAYGMPFYKYKGAMFGFAAYKDHVSLHGSVSEELKATLKGYISGRATVQFPIGKPLPARIVRKVLRARIAMAAPRRG